MSINDASRVKVAPIPAPPAGSSVVDPTFGTQVHRVTDAAMEGIAGAGCVPMYTGTQHWNADESLMLLYEQKRGHRLHRGKPPFEFIGYLDFKEYPPGQPEAVHWSTTKPTELTWLSQSGKIVRGDLATNAMTVLVEFPKAPNQAVLLESHVRPSWDDRIWGVGYWTDDTRTNKRLVVVDVDTGEYLLNAGYQDMQGADPVKDKGTAGIPMITPDGTRALIFTPTGYLVSMVLATKKVDRVVLADWTFEHQTFGRLAIPEVGFEIDVYYSKTQGKNRGGTFSAMALLASPEQDGHKLILPYAKNATNEFTWPYPTGIHLSAIAYHDPNWCWFSMMPPAEPGYVYGGELLQPLQQEIWRVNPVTGELDRMAHHRSACLGMNNIHEYWQEPHPCVSPSGRFCVFGSDWSFSLPEGERAPKIDSWVVEV